jgi:hypothetical protein
MGSVMGVNKVYDSVRDEKRGALYRHPFGPQLLQLPFNYDAQMKMMNRGTARRN